MDSGSLWTYIIGGALGVVGIGRALAAVPAVRTRRRWREADAEITYTDLDDSGRRAFRVEYRYVVDGQEYSNDEILPGHDVAVAPDSEDLFRQYPLHRHTIVFYDPQNPARSALEIDRDELVLRPLLVGLLYLALGTAGIAMIVVGWP